MTQACIAALRKKVDSLGPGKVHANVDHLLQTGEISANTRRNIPPVIQKLVSILRVQTQATREAGKQQNAKVPKLSLLLDKRDRLEKEFLAWLVKAKPHECGVVAHKKKKRKKRGRRKKKVASDPGQLPLDREEKTLLERCIQLGWPVVWFNHSRTHGCKLAPGLPFSALELDPKTLTKDIVKQISRQEGEAGLLAYFDSIGINARDSTANAIATGKHAFINPCGYFHNCPCSSHGTLKPCEKDISLRITVLQKKLARSGLKRLAALLETMEKKRIQHRRCVMHLEHPCNVCEYGTCGMNALRGWFNAEEMERVIYNEKAKAAGSCATCRDPDCAAKSCYFCKKAWSYETESGETVCHEGYSCPVYAEILQGVDPSEAYLASQYAISCKRCKDSGRDPEPFVLGDGCKMVPCEACRADYNSYEGESPNPFATFYICMSCGINLSEVDHNPTESPHFPNGCFATCCSPSPEFLASLSE
jgi:hypothetical protein